MIKVMAIFLNLLLAFLVFDASLLDFIFSLWFLFLQLLLKLASETLSSMELLLLVRWKLTWLMLEFTCSRIQKNLMW